MFFTDAKSDLNEIVYANQNFSEAVGYKRSDLLGTPFGAIILEKPMAIENNDVLRRMLSRPRVRQLRRTTDGFNDEVIDPPVPEKGSAS